MCGVCTPDDARAAAAAGADAVGMILYARGSRRVIEAEQAKAVASAIPPLVARVGVFADARAPFIAQHARALKLDLIQLHGNESVDDVRALATFDIVRAVRLDTYEQWAKLPLPNIVAILFDSAAGGSGEANDWDAVAAMIAKTPPRVPLIVAGGLRPETVGAVAARLRPWAVDVSSGIESSPAVKSVEKMTAFARALRESDATRPDEKMSS